MVVHGWSQAKYQTQSVLAYSHCQNHWDVFQYLFSFKKTHMMGIYPSIHFNTHMKRPCHWIRFTYKYGWISLNDEMRHWTLIFKKNILALFIGLWTSPAMHTKCLPIFFSKKAAGVDKSDYNFHLLLFKCLWPIRICFTLSLFAFLFPIGWMYYSSQFPKMQDVSRGVIGRRLVTHFPLSKGRKKNPPCSYDGIAALPIFLLYLQLLPLILRSSKGNSKQAIVNS